MSAYDELKPENTPLVDGTTNSDIEGKIKKVIGSFIPKPLRDHLDKPKAYNFDIAGLKNSTFEALDREKERMDDRAQARAAPTPLALERALSTPIDAAKSYADGFKEQENKTGRAQVKLADNNAP